ncbi:MAG TPA: BatA domain-containing protein [Blastocatellia bacterium]|nr:BatA domain-containing protein [Blastocatellia bacterium]
MAFLNPIFLVGALAAAVPVLVHLVRRTRAARMEFASLMFLRRIEQKTIRKRTLRNLLLLAMRCLALLLLAIAFARPYFTGQNPLAAGAEHTSSVILLDTSYSLRYPGVFDRAREAAREIIDRATPDERIALVVFGRGYEILMPLKASRAEALALLDQAAPGLDSTDYLQAVGAADALLKDAGPGPRRIHLISDFQSAGWNRTAPPVKISPGVELIPRDISAPETKNLAVIDVKADPLVFTQKYAGKVVAQIANHGPDPIEDAAIDLKLNDLVVERRQVKLAPFGSQLIEFSGFNVPEGSNRATIELTSDPFAIDNKYHFIIRRDDQTRTLAIETASRGRSQSFFIQHALAAGENSQYSLAVKTPGTVNPAEVDSYRAIIINDSSDISDVLAKSITAFVERGGGLIIAAGRHTDAGEFNRLFGAISPAQIGEVAQQRSYALMSQVKEDHPVFGAFARSGRLTSTRVYAYHRSTPSERASVIAALDDGTPMIVEGLAGRGKVILVTTSLDTTWNDLPLTPMFLPLVRQMLDYLGGETISSSYRIGQMLGVQPDRDGSLPAVDNPGGGRVDQQTQTGQVSVSADEIGFYRLRYRDRAEYLAVNLDTKESDLSKLSVEEFMAGVLPEPGNQSNRASSYSGLTPEEIESRQRLWLPLLILALALFVAEALLARRIRLARLVG